MDINKIRQETPGVKNCVHFNNAGASFSPQIVLKTVLQHLQHEQLIGGYEAAEAAHLQIQDFYIHAAKVIGAEASEIAFAESATRAWQIIFYSIDFNEGDEILTTRSEYVSNYLAMLDLQNKRGVTIKVIPDDQNGLVDLEALEKSISSKTKLVTITHIPTSNGLIHPIEEVGRITQKHGVLYFLDACQSLGQIEVDVKKVKCDFLCATGRKYLRGPRGTGFLYIKKNHIEKMNPVFISYPAASWPSINSFKLDSSAKRFENWERSYANQLGLSQALAYYLQVGPKAIQDRVTQLGAFLRTELDNLPQVKVYDRGRIKSGLVTFTGSFDNAKMNKYLRHHQINISVSHIGHARLDLQPLKLMSVCRASVHYYNTEEEIDQFISRLKAGLLELG